MTLAIPDLIWIFVFVLVSVGLLQVARLGMGQWMKWDVGEKERVQQQRLMNLTNELDKAKERVVILEKQIELLLGQYNDAIIRLNAMKTENQEALDSARKLLDELEDVRREMPMRELGMPRRRVLIAIIGDKDVGLEMDLASLRAVQMETGLEFERVTDTTPDKVKKTLDRSRQQRNQTYVHMSIHADPAGYWLGKEKVTGEWLSGVLGGVIVLVVAGCESDWLGDLLGVVPYVVTMSEKVDHRDATQFCRAFWTEIGKGIGPVRALQLALQRSPATMSEYVVRHWHD